MKSCETCQHFYECDNMGHFEECLPGMDDYEPRDRENIEEVIEELWYDVCTKGLSIESVLKVYSEGYNFSEEEERHIVFVLEKRQEKYSEEFED